MEPMAMNPMAERYEALPRRILVATDLTDGEVLLPHAIAQAKASHAHVTLVHAYELSPTPYAGPELVATVEYEQATRRAISALEDLQQKIQQQGLSCSYVAQQGSPVRVVMDALAETRADRVLVASHGRRGLEELLLGSTAKELMACAQVPVFVVGPHSHDGRQHTGPSHILHPVSLEGEYEELARFAFELADLSHARLTLLHVLAKGLSDEINPTRTIRWATHTLQALVSRFGTRKEQTFLDVRTGDAVQEILRSAETPRADLIVIGTREPFPTSRLKNGVAYRVAVKAACPIMTYRPSRPADAQEHPAVLATHMH